MSRHRIASTEQSSECASPDTAPASMATDPCRVTPRSIEAIALDRLTNGTGGARREPKACGGATRRTQRPTRPRSDMSLRWGGPCSRSGRRPPSVFWVGLSLEQLVSPFGDRQLRFELADPLGTAASSADSAVDTPARNPRSIWLRQL